MRIAIIERKTFETDIQITLNLDGSGNFTINTGVGFFDHMLTQVAVHGLLDLEIKAAGDLEVDAHHLVEDCGLVLGEAVKQALGDKKGIKRMASVFIPMDEALGQAVIDFSGRPYTVINSAWTSPTVGGLPTSLIDHFFQSFTSACMCNLHMLVHYGKDNHHMAEAMFKALGRVIAEAALIDPRRSGNIPSSKGSV